MSVVLSAEAVADLVHIADFIAIDNPVRALSFVKSLRNACETLATMPLRFPLVPRYAHLGIRRVSMAPISFSTAPRLKTLKDFTFCTAP